MRIIQFDEPGEGTRVGFTTGEDVYDITGPAGAGSLALLLAVRDGGAPDLSAAPRVAGYAELDVPPEAGRRHLRLPVDPAEVWGAGVTYKKSRSEERRVGKECRSRWSPY